MRLGVLARGVRRVGLGSAWGWGKFDCDGCAKKLETPECKACDRMVNYFKIINM